MPAERGVPGGPGGFSSVSAASGTSAVPQTLWHYTRRANAEAIVESRVLLPSLRADKPQDARYGDGQYMTDIPPGTRSRSQLSKLLVGVPFAAPRFTHYVEVDVTGLEVVRCREHVFLIPGCAPLVLERRILGWGANVWCGI